MRYSARIAVRSRSAGGVDERDVTQTGLRRPFDDTLIIDDGLHRFEAYEALYITSPFC